MYKNEYQVPQTNDTQYNSPQKSPSPDPLGKQTMNNKWTRKQAQYVVGINQFYSRLNNSSS